mmetsp:Transcript_38106/g.96439  ORF Transcript_38106/g.96439 Transcript_38106/m.96439 type:complete len:225 (-) Transcript_38106:451-1125(-)
MGCWECGREAPAENGQAPQRPWCLRSATGAPSTMPSCATRWQTMPLRCGRCWPRRGRRSGGARWERSATSCARTSRGPAAEPAGRRWWSRAMRWGRPCRRGRFGGGCLSCWRRRACSRCCSDWRRAGSSTGLSGGKQEPLLQLTPCSGSGRSCRVKSDAARRNISGDRGTRRSRARSGGGARSRRRTLRASRWPRRTAAARTAARVWSSDATRRCRYALETSSG